MRRLPKALPAALLALCALVVGVAWSLASPPVATPDEDYHLASILCPPPIATSGCATGVLDGKPAVMVPEVISERPCYVGQLGESAACQNAKSETTLVLSGRIDNGDYPGPYYHLMHGLWGPGLDATVLTIRLVNVAIAVALVGAALALAPPHARRSAGYALLTAAAPVGVFIVASVNPSSWALAGLTACWIALNSLAQVTGRGRRLGTAAVALAGTLLAAVARGDTGPFVVIIVAGLALLHVRPRRPEPVWLGTAVACLAVGAWSFLGAGQASGVASTGVEGPRNFWWVLGYDLTEILQVPAGVLGVGPWGSLGWVEVPMPTTVYVPLVALAGYWVFAGLRQVDARKAAAVGVVGGALLLLPFYMLMRNLDIAGIQPRYFLSQVPLFLALCILLPGARTALRLTRAQAVFAWVCVSVAHCVALLTVLRRYTTGFGGAYLPGADATWWWDAGPSPAVVWWVGSAAFALAALAFPALSSVGRVAREERAGVSRPRAGASGLQQSEMDGRRP